MRDRFDTNIHSTLRSRQEMLPPGFAIQSQIVLQCLTLLLIQWQIVQERSAIQSQSSYNVLQCHPITDRPTMSYNAIQSQISGILGKFRRKCRLFRPTCWNSLGNNENPCQYCEQQLLLTAVTANCCCHYSVAVCSNRCCSSAVKLRSRYCKLCWNSLGSLGNICISAKSVEIR